MSKVNRLGSHLRLKIVPSKHCTVGCGFCYWSQADRARRRTMSRDTIRAILAEGVGFQDVHFFSGEYEEFAEHLLLPALALADCYGYPCFMTTCSGIYLTKRHLEQARELFRGNLHFRLSIDGAWGHDNSSATGRHGDVLSKFLEARSKWDGITLEVNWTHKPTARNDAIRESFQTRCEKEGVHFWVSYASDTTSAVPMWGETVVPMELGLDSPELNGMVFNHCALPVDRQGHFVTQVQVAEDNTYYLCKCKVPMLRLGLVGQVGRGNLLSAVDALAGRESRFVELMTHGGIIEVTKALLRSPVGSEIVELLQDRYPRNCGGCNLCLRLQTYIPLLKEEKTAGS